MCVRAARAAQSSSPHRPATHWRGPTVDLGPHWCVCVSLVKQPQRSPLIKKKETTSTETALLFSLNLISHLVRPGRSVCAGAPTASSSPPAACAAAAAAAATDTTTTRFGYAWGRDDGGAASAVYG